METDDPARTPLWAWAVLGWLALAVPRAWRDARAEPPAGLPASGAPGPGAVPDLVELPVQALRCLPGVGDRRAVAVARARWEAGLLAPSGAPGSARVLPLTAIDGIGPRTAEQVAVWLAGRGRPAEAVLRPSGDRAPPHEEP